MKLSKNNLLIIGVIIVAVGAIVWTLSNQPQTPPPLPSSSESSLYEETVTTPDVIYSLFPESDAKLRVFNIKISKDGFSPSKIVVREDDVVQFNLTAVGSLYDLSVPHLEYYNDISQDKNIEFSFEASPAGRFSFFCKDKCPESGVVKGELIILPK